MVGAEASSAAGDDNAAGGVRSALARLRQALWQAVSWVLEEFEPWLKWMVFDSIMALMLGYLGRRWKALQPYLEALGWL